MNVRGTLTVLVAVLALSGCTFFPTPQPTLTLTEEAPRPTQDGTPPPAGILTLTPEQMQPEDVYTRSEPHGSFQVGLDLPRGFPAGIPAFTNRWVKSNFFSTINGDGRKTYSAMFVGGYDDVDAVLAEFGRQGWSDEGSDELPTRRVYIVQNDAYRVIITATESAQNQGEPIDPAYSYTIVVL